MLLDQLHSLVVHLADELMHRHVLLMRLVVEIIAPVAEIAGDDEDCILVIEVFRELAAQLFGSCWTDLSDYDRHDLQVIAQHLAEIGQMHLQTVLLLFVLLCEFAILDLSFELVDGCVGWVLLC